MPTLDPQDELILLVEDEKKLANVIVRYIEAAGYRAHWEMYGKAAVEKVTTLKPALVVLDVNLPDMDGFQVCSAIRECSQVPIMMLTARSEERSKIEGLDAGADDYVTKPFSPNELMARIRAHLRRKHWPGDKPILPGLVLDEEAYRAAIDGKNLNLTPVEFRLLKQLLANPGRVYSRSQLLDLVHDDYRETTDRAIDSHIRNLRVKLREVGPAGEVIKSVYGVGYKFEA